MRCSRFVFSLLACSMIGATLFAACNSDGRTLRPAGPGQNQSVYTPTTTTQPETTVPVVPVGAAFTTTTTTRPQVAFLLDMPWSATGVIDPRFTCRGAGTQPQFSWLGAPQGAVEMALIAVDLDAGNFVHWIIAGLDPFDPQVPEGSVPTGAIQGQNGTSTAAKPSIGWHGPCPPAGTHHYQFTLYALSQQIELPDGSAAAAMQSAIISSAIATAQVTAIYTAA